MKLFLAVITLLLSACGSDGFQAHTVNPRWLDGQTPEQIEYMFGPACETVDNPVVCARTDAPQVWRYCIAEINAPLATMDYKTVPCSSDCPLLVEVPIGADSVSTRAYVTPRYTAVVDDPSYCYKGTKLWAPGLLQHSLKDVENRLGKPCWFIAEDGYEYMLYVGYVENQDYFEVTTCKSQDTRAGMLTVILDPNIPDRKVLKVFTTE